MKSYFSHHYIYDVVLFVHVAHYMSGHAHCAEHIVIPGDVTNQWLNGLGDGCCYKASHMDTLPTQESLLYLMGNTGHDDIDDDGIEEGINGTIGGFSGVVATKSAMTVTFYNQNGTVLYESSVPSRSEAALDGSKTFNPTPTPRTLYPTEESQLIFSAAIIDRDDDDMASLNARESPKQSVPSHTQTHEASRVLSSVEVNVDTGGLVGASHLFSRMSTGGVIVVAVACSTIVFMTAFALGHV